MARKIEQSRKGAYQRIPEKLVFHPRNIPRFGGVSYLFMHINTIEVSAADMERGAREDSYARLLLEWREGKIDGEQWEQMLRLDADFRAWLFNLGAV